LLSAHRRGGNAPRRRLTLHTGGGDGEAGRSGSVPSNMAVTEPLN